MDILIFLNLFIIFFLCPASARNENMKPRFTPVHVGVILDRSTLLGKISNTSILMAIEDFYDIHDNYTTKLVLHFKDSNQDVVEAVAAAMYLLKNQVDAIIGPQNSGEAMFISILGNRTHVPIISFTATSPSLPSITNPYFIRTTLNDSAQVSAIASIMQTFSWRQAILILEDTVYGRDIFPYLLDALQNINSHIPYHSLIARKATNDQIREELYKLKKMKTRVFIIHMTAPTASRLLLLAKEAGMTDHEGFVWILTDGLTNLAESLSSSVIETLHGAIGVKMYVPKSKKNERFIARWKKRFQQENPDDIAAEMNNFALWAYDTVWALAMAAEKAGVEESDFKIRSRNTKLPLYESLKVSKNGFKLVKEISHCRFKGVSGEFKLINGHLQSSTFQIINMVGRVERSLGFWNPKTGLSKQLNKNKSMRYFPSATDLNHVVWPGESVSVPASQKKLRVLVPKSSYPELVNLTIDARSNRTNASGFSIEVFEAAVKNLPYNLSFEYFPFVDSSGESAGTYDDLLHQVYLHNYDAAVGDITIREERAQFVDFTLPYTESGGYMIVSLKEMEHKNTWIFLKPLSKDLWLGAIFFFLYTGFVVWVMEHKTNPEFKGSWTHQLGTILHFSFSTMVYAHRERLMNGLSKIVLIIWIFVVLILTSSYTASLASMLTIQKLDPSVTDLDQLVKNNAYVGSTKGSFWVDLLKVKFDEKRIKLYNSTEDFYRAMLKGSQLGGISAIIEGLPFVKLVLKRLHTNFTISGPIFKNEGLGYAFPKGSHLAHDFSRALLKIIEGEEISKIEKKWFGDQIEWKIHSSSITSSNLDLYSFRGLFLITGIVSTCALFIFIRENLQELRSTGVIKHVWNKFSAWFNHYNKEEQKSYSSDKVRPVNEENDAKIQDEEKNLQASVAAS